MNKIVSYKDIIDQISDGMTIGIGGWGARRKPMSLIREICQSNLKDLTIVSYGGPDVGLLCAHKKVKKLTNAECLVCKAATAAFTRRKTNDENIEVIGGADIYEAVCRECFIGELRIQDR